MPCSICRKTGHNARTCQSENHVKERIEYLKNALKKVERERNYAKTSVTHFRVELMTMRETCCAVRKKTDEIEKQLEKKDATIKGLRKKEKGMCNICFEELPLGEEYATKCGHCFHTGCLLKWLEKNNTCPCCRSELYEKYVIPDEYMSDEEFVDSDDDMPELEDGEADTEIEEEKTAVDGEADTEIEEEKTAVDGDRQIFTQFELDVYESMANSFGNIVTHPDQMDWMVDRNTLVDQIVQYTNYLITEDPDHPVSYENVQQLLRDFSEDDDFQETNTINMTDDVAGERLIIHV